MRKTTRKQMIFLIHKDFPYVNKKNIKTPTDINI